MMLPQDTASRMLAGLGSAFALIWGFLVPLDPIFIVDYNLPGLSHLPALSLIGLLGLWLARKRTKSAVSISIILAVAVFFSLGLVASIDPASSLRRTIIIGYYLIVLFAVYSFLAARPERAPSFLLLVGLGSLVSGFYGYALYYDAPMRLTVAPEYNPTWLGALLALSVLIFFFLGGRATSRVQMSLFAAAALLSGYLLVLTQAQTSLWSLLFSLMFWGVWRFRKDWKVSAGIAITVSAGVALVTFTGALDDGVFLQRTLDTMQQGEYAVEDADRVTSGRTALWRDFLQLNNIRILGAGWGNAPILSSWGITPHNNYITILMEAGLLGLIFFLLFLSWMFLAVNKLPYSSINVTFFLVFMMGNDMIHYKYAWIGITCILVMFEVERRGHSLLAQQSRGAQDGSQTSPRAQVIDSAPK